ncbi:unnamed protein product [Caenorhabditis brenneri]
MLLFLPILFSIPVISFESYAIDAPFKYSLRKLNGHSYKNSVTVYTIKDELTGMVKVDSQFPGCYHNGTVYTVGQEWIEENPGDKKISVMMGCQRGESGYFEKKVLGCLVTVETYSIVGTYLGNDSYHVTNETYTYEKIMELNAVEVLSDSEGEDREMERCVETEPGHVAVVKTTEEEVGCTYCLVNGTEYYVSHSREHKLSNGCTFICHDQKNIYKCPDQLSYMEVMKTATTRIPTTLRTELGF